MRDASEFPVSLPTGPDEEPRCTQDRVLVFAKAPSSARTRLVPALGTEGTARLARRRGDEALARAHAAALGPVTLCVTPDDGPFLESFQAPPGTLCVPQGGGDLGERMARAAERTLVHGDPVLLLGTDCPALDVPTLRRIAEDMCRVDAVLVPALDGGYVALGLRRFDPSLFSDISWGTPSVAPTTRARISRLGWTLLELPALPDVDEPRDLDALPAGWIKDSITWEAHADPSIQSPAPKPMSNRPETLA